MGEVYYVYAFASRIGKNTYDNTKYASSDLLMPGTRPPSLTSQSELPANCQLMCSKFAVCSVVDITARSADGPTMITFWCICNL
eukprot:4975868-Pleurochrysis_carterae.AAC.3